MAGATFPTNFDSNISEVMNPEVIILKTCPHFAAEKQVMKLLCSGNAEGLN